MLLHPSDGEHWAKARTLVVGPGGQRPYAKYAAGPDGSIHVILSEAHVRSYRTEPVLRPLPRRPLLRRRAGELVARMRDLPLRFADLDRIHSLPEHHLDRLGPWPHDVAVDGRRRPVVVYTAAATAAPTATDVFWYARCNGSRWERHRIVGAGTSLRWRSSAAASRSTTPGPRASSSAGGAARGCRVELWRTPDSGDGPGNRPWPITPQEP